MGQHGSLAQDLVSIVGHDNVRSDPTSLIPFRTDATPLFSGVPDAVVFPSSTDQVSRIARYATDNAVPLIVRGAGTNLSAGTVPIVGGIVMPLTRLDRIVDIDVDEQTVRLEPSVTTAELDDAAAGVGLMYPPDPGSRSVSTIGGNIATNAGGLRGLKYGVTGDYVLSLTAVLATGEVIRTGTPVRKDVAGYNLTALLVGSEGTLAIVTEAVLALVARPAHEALGVASFDELADASSAVAAIIRAGIRPSTLEFLDRTCIEVVDDFSNLGLDRDAGALLFFGDDGSREAAEATVEEMQGICILTGARSATRSESITHAADLLAARRCTLPALSRLAPVPILEDIGVPRSRLVAMVDEVYAIAGRWSLKVAVFGHAGDGNLHPTFLVDPDDGDATVRAAQAIGEMFDAAIEMGGTITGEHGVGAAKLAYLSRQIGSDQMDLQRRVKQAFDPAHILNPGKLGS